MSKNNKYLSAMVLFIGLGTTLAFMANNNQSGILYYYEGTGCGPACAAAPCETTNNSGIPCGITALYTDNNCSQPYTGSAWALQTVNSQ
jgi:hypothetical protein